MYNIQLKLRHLEDTKKLAIMLAGLLKKGDVILLKGDLGAGKSTFTRFLIQHLFGWSINVSSPTFNLVHVYEVNDMRVWHYDLYRLKSATELYELGLEESLSSGISIIEWPELIENNILNDRIVIKLQNDPSNDEVRVADILAYGDFESNNVITGLKNEFG